MSAHPTEELLNDYVDGLLPASERKAAELHLAGCAECRAEVEGLRTLLLRVAELPREIAPPGEVWEALRGDTVDLPGWWTFRFTRRELAAAAVVLMVLSSALTAALLRGRSTREPILAPVVVRPAVRGVPVELRRAEGEYARATVELEAALRAQRGQLAPGTVQVLEESLRIIDRAIGDARAALARDPANAEISHALDATYREKIDVLERAVRLAAQT
ncbi:MAG TPA: zf-HC2 domain-containing protein [Longimicrobiaceae bacterium]|nr:zf-HC2 domain-containing protein [Longimicrobiaceae bacterium]